MNEQEALSKMRAPGEFVPRKYKGGIIQVHVTRACDKSCYGCTQMSNGQGPYKQISTDNFYKIVKSLKSYFGVVGMFGGNPALHKDFPILCEIIEELIPFERRGIWCNNPLTPEKARIMRRTFNPAVCNLNVHLDLKAKAMFNEHWPEAPVYGHDKDSKHSPTHGNPQDLVDLSEGERWERISECDINRWWSAMGCELRGEARGFFCEVAGAAAMIRQDDPAYPDLGVPITGNEKPLHEWWRKGMPEFASQVRQACHNECLVPYRGAYKHAIEGQGAEVTTVSLLQHYKPKLGRGVTTISSLAELGTRENEFTDYLR